MAKKTGLGKGLDALFGPVPQEEEVKENDVLKNLKITEVEPNRDQPRKNFNQEALEELAESIKEYGLIQPILVTQRDGYYNLRENVSSWNLTGLDSSYYICITKPGYIPYVAKVADTVYIQNQTFTDDYDIYSDKTFIGKDVTDEQPHGDVVIERGKTTITHNNGVTIKNGFTVKNGAEFKITKN